MRITKKYILNFLQHNQLGVLASVNTDGKPDAAAIYFHIDKNFRVFFVSPEGTHKFANIQSNPHVTLTVTNEETKETVCLHGKATTNNDALHSTLEKISESLQKDFEFVKTLPLFTYKGKKKHAVEIVPYKICFRKYTDTKRCEKILTFKI